MLRALVDVVGGVRRGGCSLLAATSVEQNLKACVHHHKERHNLRLFLGIKRSNPARANRNTHVNERMFRKLRGQKTVLIDLPEDNERRREEQMRPDDLRIKLLKKGINPLRHTSPRIWNEHQITVTSLGAVIDPYVTPEETSSFEMSDLTGSLTIKGIEWADRLKHKWGNYKNGIRRIRKKQGFEKFNLQEFASKADDIYVDAHKALVTRDKKELLKYITENAFSKMWPDVEEGSVVWEMVEHKEPSRVVGVRCIDVPLNSGNDIAQVIVRMHTLQKLAVYDRFGRLILGSEVSTRDVLEYVVFENHIAVIDGEWRLHDKVYPHWLKPKAPSLLTIPLNDRSDESRPQGVQKFRVGGEVERRKEQEANDAE